MTYVPSLGNKLKRVFSKQNCQLFFKSGPKLGNLLSRSNKTQPPLLDKKGVYMHSCSCTSSGIVPKYVGQTGVSFNARDKQHKYDVSSSKANVSGISEHARMCQHGTVAWDNQTYHFGHIF